MATTVFKFMKAAVNGEVRDWPLEKVRSETTGKLLNDHINDAITAAITAFKTGDFKTLSDNYGALQDAVNAFLNGEADGGTMDRLVELVTAINNNKDSIDGLLEDKVNISDIIDNLTTNDATKVLSAKQGKALKDLIDALNQDSHTHANKEILDGIAKDAAGDLTYNGKTLNGKTGIAYVSRLGDTPTYNGQIQLILTELEVEEEPTA